MNYIIGHELLKERLISRFKQDPYGTFLFHGPSSIGKRTVSFELSKKILCENSLGEDCPCMSCKKFNAAEHPDFLCVGRQETIKVVDIDRVLEFVETTSFLSKSKIIIIDNAHDITWEAANRLLKVLEEPPPKITFFLVSSEPSVIIPTILSRCIKYEFNSLSREDITNIIWKKLGFELPQAKTLGWLAVNSSMDIFSKVGLYLKYREMAFEFLSELKTRSLLDSMDYIDKIDKNDLSIFTDLIIILLTDFLLLKNGVPHIANDDLFDEILETTEKINDKALIAIVNLFSQIKNIKYNLNLNIHIKNALIKSYNYLKS